MSDETQELITLLDHPSDHLKEQLLTRLAKINPKLKASEVYLSHFLDEVSLNFERLQPSLKFGLYLKNRIAARRDDLQTKLAGEPSLFDAVSRIIIPLIGADFFFIAAIVLLSTPAVIIFASVLAGALTVAGLIKLYFSVQDYFTSKKIKEELEVLGALDQMIPDNLTRELQIIKQKQDGLENSVALIHSLLKTKFEPSLSPEPRPPSEGRPSTQPSPRGAVAVSFSPPPTV